MASNEVIIVRWRVLDEDIDETQCIANSFRFKALVHSDLCIFHLLIHIPAVMLRLCQMADNYTKLSDSPSHSQHDVTEPSPSAQNGKMVGRTFLCLH